jgi:hypothetical protein
MMETDRDQLLRAVREGKDCLVTADELNKLVRIAAAALVFAEDFNNAQAMVPEVLDSFALLEKELKWLGLLS